MEHRIDSYSFGRIVIDGKSYTNDVIITPGKVVGNWWRKDGHVFSLEDLSEAFASSPEALILGTGASGLCRVMKEVGDYCRNNGIELFIGPTDEMIAKYNAAIGGDAKGIVAAFHLTC